MNKTRFTRIAIALLIIALTILLAVSTLPGGSLNGEKTVDPNSSWITSRPDGMDNQKTIAPNSSWNNKQP